VTARSAEQAYDDLAVTETGLAQLTAELETLRTEARHDLAERLRQARADGDPTDNVAFYELLEEQAQLERRIAVLDERLAGARVAPPSLDGSAGVGTSVEVRDVGCGDVAVYELVGAIEADVGNGRVSVSAPVGRALLGRRAGETVDVQTPLGLLTLELLDVWPTRARAA
jgi:transcription elongation factor GreA